MDHLSDYVRWMQDFPISMTGFRDEDALILCALSYFDLSPLFSSGSECPSVRDCGQMIKNGQLRILVTGSSEGYPELLAYAPLPDASAICVCWIMSTPSAGIRRFSSPRSAFRTASVLLFSPTGAPTILWQAGRKIL